MDEEPHRRPVSRDLPGSVSQLLLTLAGCSTSVVVGIDVGGPKKGFHAVALSATKLLIKFRSADPATVAHWCREQGAEVIAIDAPCRWRRPGGPARAAERKLAEIRISCFSTPTEEQASGHPFYTWMLAGQELYAAQEYVQPDGDQGMVEYDLGGGTFSIGCGAPMFKPGGNNVAAALEVDDFTAAVEHLRGHKVKFAMEPFENPQCSMVLIEDPDGNPIMIHRRK